MISNTSLVVSSAPTSLEGGLFPLLDPSVPSSSASQFSQLISDLSLSSSAPTQPMPLSSAVNQIFNAEPPTNLDGMLNVPSDVSQTVTDAQTVLNDIAQASTLAWQVTQPTSITNPSLPASRQSATLVAIDGVESEPSLQSDALIDMTTMTSVYSQQSNARAQSLTADTRLQQTSIPANTMVYDQDQVLVPDTSLMMQPLSPIVNEPSALVSEDIADIQPLRSQSTSQEAKEMAVLPVVEQVEMNSALTKPVSTITETATDLLSVAPVITRSQSPSITDNVMLDAADSVTVQPIPAPETNLSNAQPLTSVMVAGEPELPTSQSTIDQNSVGVNTNHMTTALTTATTTQSDSTLVANVQLPTSTKIVAENEIQGLATSPINSSNEDVQDKSGLAHLIAMPSASEAGSLRQSLNVGAAAMITYGSIPNNHVQSMNVTQQPPLSASQQPLTFAEDASALLNSTQPTTEDAITTVKLPTWLPNVNNLASSHYWMANNTVSTPLNTPVSLAPVMAQSQQQFDDSPAQQSMHHSSLLADTIEMSDHSDSDHAFSNVLATTLAANSPSTSVLAALSAPLNMRHPQWTQEVAQRLHVMVNQAMNQLEVRLDPLNLGPMRIKLSLDAEKQAHISLSAQHGLTRDLLENALPRLKELLAQEGILVASVSVGSEQQQQTFAQGHEKSLYNSASELSEDVANPMVEQPKQRTKEGLVDHFV